jgi:hypothetical protein
LASKYRAEHAAARAVESMFREPVHAAFLNDSSWEAENVDAVDLTELHLPGRDGVVACIAELLENIQAADARLIRIHDHLWLRIWQSGRPRRPESVRDIVLPLRGELAALSAQGSTVRTR